MAVIKQQVYADWDSDLETVRTGVVGLMHASLDGPDFKEGVRSFLKKRPVAFAPLGPGQQHLARPRGWPRLSRRVRARPAS